MAKHSTRWGTGGFLEAIRDRYGTRPSAPTLRILCASGILKPIVSNSGWRTYSDSDLEAFGRWLATRS